LAEVWRERNDRSAVRWVHTFRKTEHNLCFLFIVCVCVCVCQTNNKQFIQSQTASACERERGEEYTAM
jgi:hypothetical protein